MTLLKEIHIQASVAKDMCFKEETEESKSA